ncbi:MAG: leucyl/phenylalanyl-tRNA--protein transferase [Desulfobacteraceae bacterium]|nr:MAG: leucyl/phenylalanyl-tRNA--protein transferase [Desulfobacteraceae bacterium]
MPIFLLSEKLSFPPPHLATKEGLLAVGGDLRPERLILAYRNGIFPWYSENDPILWWSPDPRLVLYPEELHISGSLRRTIRRSLYQMSFDTDFEGVISACAQLRLESLEGTWITPEMKSAYVRLHELGIAHSVEARFDGKLVGGLYGVSLGRAFFGESMFSRMNDASKVCLVYLASFLKKQNFSLIDCQVHTEHLMRMGARVVKRNMFLKQLRDAIDFPSLEGSWRYHASNTGQSVSLM